MIVHHFLVTLLLVLAVIFYDYMLTFSGEMELFWKRNWRSWPFVLFVANRYIIIMGHFPAFAYSFLHSSHSWYAPCITVSYLCL
ncbi:hypothetical protein V8B97DRAFT_1984993, partial [Scleroderma yunnanense]